MSEPLNETIAVLPKNSREDLRVTLTEYRGAQYVDIRLYTAGDDGHPTKSGVTCSFERLPQLLMALDKAERRARDLGLMDGVR